MEVYPGIWRIALPIPGHLGVSHSYLIRGEDGVLLVDSGWNSPEGWDALAAGLAAAGVEAGRDRIDRLLITHEHPDHIGMATQIKKVFHAQILMHSAERVFVRPRYAEPNALLDLMTEWLKTNGVPAENLSLIRDASLFLTGGPVPEVDQNLYGSEVLGVGDFRWRVVWTPGHTAGHICLYEPNHKVLISGDHVLPNQSPNISLHPQSTPNPLADYLDSLTYLKTQAVDLVLPAHGEPFSALHTRIAAIIEHHLHRVDEVKLALQSGAKSGWDTAHHIVWMKGRKRFEELDSWSQRAAVVETLSHLEWIRSEGATRKDFSSGVIRYYLDEGFRRIT